MLKSGFGWSDEQLEEQLAYNVQVRYAPGYHDLSQRVLELRTVYNFRRRVAEFMQETGINLIEQIWSTPSFVETESPVQRSKPGSEIPARNAAAVGCKRPQCNRINADVLPGVR